MNTTCPGCGRQVGTYDLCSHRNGEFKHRVCFGCCLETHHTPTDKEVPEWAR